MGEKAGGEGGREARLRAALRDNLRKRRAQGRGVRPEGTAGDGGAGGGGGEAGEGDPSAPAEG